LHKLFSKVSKLKKKTIVLASVLKPIDDPRMYEKIGSSLCPQYNVHIIGHQSVGIPNAAIQFHPIFNFSFSEKKRKKAGQSFLNEIAQIKPDVLIVHTPELLWFALLYKFKNKIKLVYDVRENYWRNIVYQTNYKGLRKWFLAAGVRLTEWVSSHFVDAIFLAEKCYAQEMPFLTQKAVVLENKFKKQLPLVPRAINAQLGLPLKVICTGTFSEVYGTERAIQWVLKLRELGYEITLLLIGKIATKALEKKIQFYTKQHPFIQLEGGGLVPHKKILEALHQADLALLPYEPNESTKECIPTKMYECWALQIPMLVQKNQLWERLCKPVHAAIFTDFEPEKAENDLLKILEMPFYMETSVGDFFWETEEEKLIKTIDSLMG